MDEGCDECCDACFCAHGSPLASAAPLRQLQCLVLSKRSGSGSSECRDASAAAPALAMSIKTTQLQRYREHALCTVSKAKCKLGAKPVRTATRKTAALCVRPTSGVPSGAESACFGHVTVGLPETELGSVDTTSVREARNTAELKSATACT